MNQVPNPEPRIPNVILIGYRGTGKTTVGRLLAKRLNWAFVDADDEVECAAGKSIAEIFAEDGEVAFRDLEQQTVADLTQRPNTVVSLGGGAVLRSENRAAIRAGGSVIWLTASPTTIHARMNADATTGARRPNLTSQGGLAEIEELLQQREAFYRECADLEIDTDDVAIDDLAVKILDALS